MSIEKPTINEKKKLIDVTDYEMNVERMEIHARTLFRYQ